MLWFGKITVAYFNILLSFCFPSWSRGDSINVAQILLLLPWYMSQWDLYQPLGPKEFALGPEICPSLAEVPLDLRPIGPGLSVSSRMHRDLTYWGIHFQKWQTGWSSLALLLRTTRKVEQQQKSTWRYETTTNAVKNYKAKSQEKPRGEPDRGQLLPRGVCWFPGKQRWWW